MQRVIVSITGTRADWGLMTPVYDAIGIHDRLRLELVVTGMHLLPEFSSSLEQIKAGFGNHYHVAKMLHSGDDPTAVAQSVGSAIVSMGDIFGTIQPDLLLLQGDRSEMLAAAVTAIHMNIPIVHMSGGDFSGSIDDSIRNAISKIAHIHLATCEASTRRLVEMGEDPRRIFEVGEPGLDLIRKMAFLSFNNVCQKWRLNPERPIALMTQHPVTTESKDSAWQIRQTLEALDELDLQVVLTYPNTDLGGQAMREVIQTYRAREKFKIVENLGSNDYLNLMKYASVIVGNSSSGILEAPSFQVPAVNIGTRQYGRVRACNVIDVDYDKAMIKEAIQTALHDATFRQNLANCRNPYGDGYCAEKTVAILDELSLTPALLNKWLPATRPFIHHEV